MDPDLDLTAQTRELQVWEKFDLYLFMVNTPGCEAKSQWLQLGPQILGHLGVSENISKRHTQCPSLKG